MILRPLAALAVLGATFALGAPAHAATCVTTTHTTTTGILTTQDGEPGGPASNATVTLRATGVDVALPDALSKAQFLVPAPSNTALADVTDLRLRMRQVVPGSVVLPSYQLVIDPEPTVPAGVHFATLVFEPYLNGYAASTATRTFDADEPFVKWWSTRALPALPAADGRTALAFSAFVTAYPGARVLAYGWNSGKGNAGQRAVVTSVAFETDAMCSVHAWVRPVTPSSPSASVSVSPSASNSPTASPSASVSRTPSRSPTASPSTSAAAVLPDVQAPSDPDALPVTGSSLVPRVAGLGVVALVAGFGVVWFARRRTRH